MKIYFAGSIRAGRGDADLYARLVDELKNHGTVLTEHVGDVKLLEGEKLDEKFIHDRDLDWLEESDLLVAEVTQPSLGVGYEIGRAVAMKKPVFCMYRPSPDKRLSAMIEGAKNDTDFTVRHYKEEEAITVLKEFLAKFNKKEELDTE